MAEPPTPKLRRKARRSLLPSMLTWLFGLLVLIALAWTGFWLFAAHEAAASLDAWIAREKVFHRRWLCPDRQVGGYPFAIAISCEEPQFDGMIFGQHYTGTLARFVATAQFANRSDVTVNVGAPFTARSDDKSTTLHLTWEQMAVRLGGVPQNVTEVSVAGQTVNLQGYAPGLGPLSGQAGAVHVRLTHNAARTDDAMDFHIVLTAASVPSLDAFLGGAAAADVTADGTLTQASFDPARTLAHALDQWRVLGGQMQLANLTVTRGETRIEAHGTLGLDAAHEVQGKLDTKCVGFEQILLKLGVDPGLVSVGSLLSSLLSGHSANEGPQPLHLPVGFDSGRLSIGPVDTSIRLPPIY